MTFWDWCHEHYVIAGFLVFLIICVIDQMQANYFRTRK